MKIIYILIASCFLACNESAQDHQSGNETDSVELKPGTDENSADTNPDPAEIKDENAGKAAKIYANDRFREVTVTKVGDHSYTVQGKGQIFEASFNWVVEDGHNELKKGYQMTDAGAPEWGAFKFTIEVQKQRPNSTLTLILFEASAKDGSRQHELPIVLE